MRTKKISVFGREIEVKSLSFLDMSRLQLGNKVSLYELLLLALKPEDVVFLEQQELDPKQSDSFKVLIDAFVECNPCLTKVEAQSFLSTEPQGTSGELSTSLPQSSDGQLTK